MEHHITADRVQEMKQYLKDHPIDPAWDWEWSRLGKNNIPWEQKKARIYKSILQDIGEMEKDPPAPPPPYPAKEIARMKQYIKDHPIHPELDEAAETWDISVPIEELTARSYRGILQKIGEWEE
ncbi:MAG: hypothetical protein HDT27_04175 [Subdoligranulum sp.]|nr:hypothetical protein [Subdoligranulum sp.]MBD5101889.1 hypothetical protein [Subdoligranulum sp.]